MRHIQGVFVRHAISELNSMTQYERGECARPTHSFKLTDVGKIQSRELGAYFRSQGIIFDVCFHSTYECTKETVERLIVELEGVAPTIIEDPRLDEKSDGIFDYLTAEQLRQRYPDQSSFDTRRYHYRPLGGQNCADIEMQIRSFESEVVAEFKGKRILVVGHLDWLQLYRKVRHRLTVAEYLELIRCNTYLNCGILTYGSDADKFHAPECPPDLTWPPPRLARN